MEQKIKHRYSLVKEILVKIINELEKKLTAKELKKISFALLKKDQIDTMILFPKKLMKKCFDENSNMISISSVDEITEYKYHINSYEQIKKLLLSDEVYSNLFKDIIVLYDPSNRLRRLIKINKLKKSSVISKILPIIRFLKFM